MEHKFETEEYDWLLKARKNQLAQFRNIPNQLEVVWQKEGGVIINNSSSTDLESALEAVSAVKERIIWITELDYSEINFHGVLGPLLERLDWVINVGLENPFQSLGKGAVNKETLEEAVEFAWNKMNEQTYVIYAPANKPENSLKERGERFREVIKEVCQ